MCRDCHSEPYEGEEGLLLVPVTIIVMVFVVPLIIYFIER